jgi:hypothetical protein
VAKTQRECFEAGVRFARTEGIVPAPEPTHTLAACIEEALRCKETGDPRVILTALCGHGHLDLAANGAYLAGTLTDHEPSTEEVEEYLAARPGLTRPRWPGCGLAGRGSRCRLVNRFGLRDGTGGRQSLRAFGRCSARWCAPPGGGWA